MAPLNPIQAMLAAKAQLGAAPPGAPMADPMAPPMAPPMGAPMAPAFPSTDPTAVASALSPQFNALEQGDQMALAEQQNAAAQGAFQMLLANMAAGPNPMAAAAQGGPARPTVGAPVGPDDPAADSGY